MAVVPCQRRLFAVENSVFSLCELVHRFARLHTHPHTHTRIQVSLHVAGNSFVLWVFHLSAFVEFGYITIQITILGDVRLRQVDFGFNYTDPRLLIITGSAVSDSAGDASYVVTFSQV